MARRSPDGWRALLRTTVTILGSPASSGRRARTTARRRSTRRSRETASCRGAGVDHDRRGRSPGGRRPVAGGDRLRRVSDEADVRAISVMHEEIFGGRSPKRWRCTARRLGFGDGMELWVAEAEGRDRQRRPAGARARHRVRRDLGRRHTPEWRGRGIYRALTAARARSALRLGKTLHPERLHRVLAAHPRTVRDGQGVDDHPVPVGRRQVGARGTPAASGGPAFANDARARVWASADLLGQPDENALGASDVAEPIHVLVLDYFVDELRAVLASRASVSSRSSTANMTRR